MIIKQLALGAFDVFTYILACEQTKQAMVVDPVGDMDILMAEVENAELDVIYILNTHTHGDHTMGNQELKSRTGAEIVAHTLEADAVNADIRLDQEKEFTLGEISIRIFHTPGHTIGGICLYADGNLITGDTLFVSDSGRTDMPGGDRSTLGASIRSLMELPDDTIVWPGHNYGPTPHSTLAWEKKNNVNAREYGFYEE